jgi:hypothetical protein
LRSPAPKAGALTGLGHTPYFEGANLENNLFEKHIFQKLFEKIFYLWILDVCWLNLFSALT